MSKKIISIFILIITLFITVNVYADDYPDDIYDGDYSIKDMLRNYSVVTFGQKDYDAHATILRGNAPGSLQIFHIIGNFIVKGDLVLTFNNNSSNNEYSVSFFCNKESSNYDYCKRTIRNGDPSFTKKSLDDNKLSYFEGTAVIKFNSCPYNYNYSETTLHTDEVYSPTETPYCIVGKPVLPASGKYINIERLYTSIIEEQNKIKKGRLVSVSNKTAHIEIGGEYYIDDINKIDNIILDNINDNGDKPTVITINNNSIFFPKIYDNELGEDNLIPTNDFIDSKKPNNSYPGNYVLNKYKGNIIWNIPNATYIKLPSAPFIGHIIAPNADIEGPELHYAGAFLVNSLSLKGNSEAHFYPLGNINIPYKSNINPLKAELNIKRNQGNIIFNNGINNESLEEGMVVSFKVDAESDYLFSGIEIKDEEGNYIEFKEIGNREYEFTMPATDITITPQFKEKNIENIIEQIITNPKTGSYFILVLGIIIVSFLIGFKIITKKKID